jgi:hypothetical protein
MEPGEIDGRTVGTGVNVASGVGDGAIDASDDATGFGDGDSFGDAAGDAFDFFFSDDAFAFFFFVGVGVFFGVGFFFLRDAFGFGLGDLLGVGDVFAAASGFSSDETCAEACGVTARTLAISSHKQKRAAAHVTKRDFRRAEAPEQNLAVHARVHGAESRSVFRPATATNRSDTSRSAG